MWTPPLSLYELVFQRAVPKSWENRNVGQCFLSETAAEYRKSLDVKTFGWQRSLGNVFVPRWELLAADLAAVK